MGRNRQFLDILHVNENLDLFEFLRNDLLCHLGIIILVVDIHGFRAAIIDHLSK